jgi:hypothetical protein
MTKELILSGTLNQIQAQLELWGLEYEEGKQYYSKLPDIEAVIYLGRRIAKDGEYDEEGNETKAPKYTAHHFIHVVTRIDLPVLNPSMTKRTRMEAQHGVASRQIPEEQQ